MNIFYSIGDKVINSVAVHDQQVTSLAQINKQVTLIDNPDGEKNQTTIVTKIVWQHLGPPYGHCTDYKTRNGIDSHIHCYRMCIQNEVKLRFNCIPLFIDSIASESDFTLHNSNNSRFCSEIPNLRHKHKAYESKVKKLCLGRCPVDCRSVEYSSRTEITDVRSGNDQWFSVDRVYRTFEKRVVWDSSQPMHRYIEEPVTTFTDYLVYCGGLTGLWFGASAQDLVIQFTKTNVLKLINHTKSLFCNI